MFADRHADERVGRKVWLPQLFPRLDYVTLFLAILGVCLWGLSVEAMNEAPLTLKQAIDQALVRYPQAPVLAAREAEVEALAGRGQSLTAGSPAIVVSYFDDRPLTNTGFYELEGGFEVPLWRWGQRRASQKVANAARVSLKPARAVLRLEVGALVREAIWQAALAQNNLELANEELKTARALEQDVERRVVLGELAKTDRLLAEAETLREETVVAQATAERQRSEETYRVLTGFPRLPIARSETVHVPMTIGSDHPLLLEANARIAQARTEFIALRSAGPGAPQLFLGARQEKGADLIDATNSLGIGLRLPFGGQAHRQVEVTAAARALAEATAERDALVRRLGVTLTEAKLDLKAIEAAYQLAQSQNRIAREHFRLMRIAFEVGETDLVNLLRVQGQAFAAERAERELAIQRERAVARLNQAAGTVP